MIDQNRLTNVKVSHSQEHLFSIIHFLVFTLLPLIAEAQAQDSVRILKEITVKAYATDRRQEEVGAALGIIKESDLIRFSNTTLLPVVNAVPGVRMEERSPGSYRFSIRGSSLRSPFGVRNVKFYWNLLPLTDGGGNTYLNLIDFNAVGGMEIIKGPAGSLYGAGTGGVVLLQSPSMFPPESQYTILGGSYGLFRVQGSANVIHSKTFQMNMRFSYQKSDGYRVQTKMDRIMAQLDWKTSLGKRSTLSGSLFSSQLYYQTPGGLTLTQYEADPQQARPGTGTAGGAVEQQAAVTNRTTYTGITLEHEWDAHWSARVGAFGSITDFKNPTIRNYEKRKETNFGGRGDVQYRFDENSIKGKFTFGAEYQQFYSPVTVYDNLQGTPGNVQTDDKLRSKIFSGFVQADIDLPGNIFVTLGGSATLINYNFLRTSVVPEIEQERNFDLVFSPRISLLKKLSNDVSIYGSVSNGFSPPSLAEVRPSTGAFNNTLNAERGINYEAGLKGNFFNAITTSLSLYDFRLEETIVIQRDASGADYFVNAGSTRQQGIEFSAAWNKPFDSSGSPSRISNLRLWTSLTYNYYKFAEYVNDGIDYSGKSLTGVPPLVLVFGGDLTFKKGFYLNATASFNDRLPLNDGNTEYASEYLNLSLRLGYKVSTRIPMEFFAGIDNLLDQRYSLGNDLNAVGGRYYNAAPARNFYAGLTIRIPGKPVSD